MPEQQHRRDGTPLWERVPGATGPNDPRFLEAMGCDEIGRPSGLSPELELALRGTRGELLRRTSSAPFEPEGRGITLKEFFGPERFRHE